MKYKVGDMVRIRKDLSTGDSCFTEKMLPFAGELATITMVYYSRDVYEIDIDHGLWVWHESMLEDVAKETDATDKTIRPDYYQYRGGDVFDMADYFQLSPPLTMALKYLLRAGHKSSETEITDLNKCMKCISRHIELMEGKDNV